MRILILSAAAMLAAAPAFAQMGGAPGAGAGVGANISGGTSGIGASVSGGASGSANAVSGTVAPSAAPAPAPPPVPAAQPVPVAAAVVGVPATPENASALMKDATVTGMGGATLGTIASLSLGADGAVTGVNLRSTSGVRVLPLSTLTISTGGVRTTYTPEQFTALPVTAAPAVTQ